MKNTKNWLKEIRTSRFYRPAKNIVTLAILAGLVYGGCKGCSNRMKAINEYHATKINKMDALYPEGATLIDKSRNKDATESRLWLDVDGHTNNADLLIKGWSANEIDDRMWQESHIGEKNSIKEWGRRLRFPRIYIISERKDSRGF